MMLSRLLWFVGCAWLCWVVGLSDASAQTFSLEKHTVTARGADGAVLWTRSLDTEDTRARNDRLGWLRKKQEKRAARGKGASEQKIELLRPHGVVQLGDAAFFAFGSMLHEVEAQTGAARFTRPLRGSITGIKADNGQLVVSLLRDRTSLDHAQTKTSTLRVTPGVWGLPFTYRQGALRAHDETGAVRWSHTLRFLPSGLGAANHPFFDPLVVGDHVYYGRDETLFETNLKTGVVQRRLVFPSKLRALEVKGDAIHATIHSREGEQPAWRETREIRAGTPFARWGISLPGAVLSEAIMWSRWSQRVESRAVYLKRRRPTSPEKRAEMEAQLVTIRAAIKQDATNPHLGVTEALFALLLDREDEARIAAEAAIKRTPLANAGVLLHLACEELDTIDPKLGDRAFARAMDAVLAQGEEPRLAHRVGLVPTVDDLRGAEFTGETIAMIERAATRHWRYAPFQRDASLLYMKLATYHQEQGDAKRAATWRARAEEARRTFGLYGLSEAEAKRAVWSINHVLVFPLALLLVVLIRLLRASLLSFQAPTTGLRRWNPLARWSRGELVGVGLLCLCLFPLARQASDLIHRAERERYKGSFVHVGSIPLINTREQLRAKVPETPERQFLIGTALIQAGRHAEAQQTLTGITTPHAGLGARIQNNLGALAIAQGDAAKAKERFKAALALDPTLAEARVNAGASPAPGSSLAQLRATAPERPLMAPLSLAGRARFLHTVDIATSRPGETGRIGEDRTFHTIATASGPADDDEQVVLGHAVKAVAALALLLFLVACLPGTGAPLRPARRGWLGWGLGWLIPGCARQYGPTGGLVTLLFMGALFGAVTCSRDAWEAFMFMPEGLGLLATHMHEVGRSGGESLLFDMSWSGPAIIAQASFTRLAIALFVINLVVLFVAERRWPDPAGPFAERETEAEEA